MCVCVVGGEGRERAREREKYGIGEINPSRQGGVRGRKV